MGWLSKEYVKGYKTDPVLLEMARELASRLKLRVCVPDEAQKRHVQALLAKGKVNLDNVTFYTVPFTMLYWRDFGPIFTVDQAGNKSIADFNFNCWGYFPLHDTQARMMERIDRTVARDLKIPSRMTRLVSEGGDREFNGKGTLLVTESCEFQRNPNLSRQDIEAELKRTLGVTNIIWLKQGTVDDDPYNTSTLPGPGGKGVAYRSAAANNHMDEYCRFVAPDTILLAEVSQEEAAQGPVEKENRRRMEENRAILQKAKDQDGKPFKIVRIPMPQTLYFTAQPSDEAYYSLAAYPAYRDGTSFPLGHPVTIVPAQSYCNFLISNGLVLAQKYWQPGMPLLAKEKDLAAQKILQGLFPNRKVVAVNTLAINFGGGGIHCSTQQEPATAK
ncbi:MAG: agmatine deiminase family protein [Desulfarculaceae bacterium]|nr:agmatine deiminase family protein [Desulfarculaceae bacterium]MCF8064024.1 agmatine deiminase family protein [Desulfarculaceae bacterium]MCF8096257.1 agmatine deiminase family protein [Desulfarculaceae bacterium]MCF8123475.1 agmatine deiminase family protein [Desulfarculaceae bacterium]